MRVERFKIRTRRPTYPRRQFDAGASKDRWGYHIGCWEPIPTLYGMRMKLQQTGATKAQIKAATRDCQRAR